MGRSPFAEKSILVTGASSGLGRAMALDLAKAGAKVGIIARRANLLDELATEIRAIGGQVHSACADVADWESLRAAVQQIETVCGPAELMIANAGLGAPSPLDAESHVREIGAMIRTNTMGVVHSFAAVLPGMLDRGRGHLVAISSLAAYIPFAGEGGYSASKAAVNAYTGSLREQVRPMGIRVTTICPGFITTPMTAGNHGSMPGVMSAEKASHKILAAIQRGREVYNFPLITVALLRLLNLLPGWLLRRVITDLGESKVD